jgi:outer membrane protein TolC
MKRLALLSLAVANVAHGEPLTFERAIETALGHHPDIAAARESAEGASEHVSNLKSKRLPGLHVDFAGNRYREPYKLMFGPDLFTLHEATTTTTGVTLTQPLTGLAYLSELVGAAEHETAAQRDDYDRTRLDTAYRAAESYIRLLEARAGAGVAHQTVADIQASLDRAVQLRKAETYTDIDVLRFRTAKASADQTALRADTTVQTATATLVVHLGLPDGSVVDVADDLPPTPPPIALALEQAQGRAMQTRPELRAARQRLAAADDNRRAAKAPYFPDIRAIASWEHQTGTQPFLPKDEELVGVRFSWNVWDWGATHHAVVEAEHAKQRASITASSVAEQVRVDVRRRWLDAKTAFDSIAVAQAQQQTAEEAYRLQKIRFEASAATTTDVLDAETDVARARLGFAIARYDYYLALFALARSVGDLPTTH